jgi:sulfoxide reductase heme-binding subunit YedZ
MSANPALAPAPPLRSYLPWTDRRGSLSWLRLIVFLAVVAPALWIAAQALLGWLGAKPVTEAIHQSGDWAIQLLILGLAITPLRLIGPWPQLIGVRRMVGLAALGYVLLHVGLYVVEQGFDLGKVASEIVLRVYLTIGFVAVLALIALGLTSTDGMIRRLGAERWNRLHALVYPATALGILHFFLQSKIDVSNAVIMAGLFYLVLGVRLLRRRNIPLGAPSLLLLAVGVALLTGATEAAWYAAKSGVDPSRVLAANLDFSFSVRPLWWVLGWGVALALVAVLPRPARAKPPRHMR